MVKAKKQKQKSKQKHTRKLFVWFHNHSPLFTGTKKIEKHSNAEIFLLNNIPNTLQDLWLRNSIL